MFRPHLLYPVIILFVISTLSGCKNQMPVNAPLIDTLTPTIIPIETPKMPSGSGSTWNLVVIGDSSLWGFGDAYKKYIEEESGVTVEVTDFAVGGLSAGSVLQVLQTGNSPDFNLGKLPKALPDADVIVMFVNPRDSIDIAYPLDLEGCFFNSMPKACPPESFIKYTEDLTAIWTKVLEARYGTPTLLYATDIYNPLVSLWVENDVFNECNDCWINMSNAARSAAESLGIPFISRYDAFNGANHLEDPRKKGFILDDGEHPTELAGLYTAELFSEKGENPIIP